MFGGWNWLPGAARLSLEENLMGRCSQCVTLGRLKVGGGNKWLEVANTRIISKFVFSKRNVKHVGVSWNKLAGESWSAKKPFTDWVHKILSCWSSHRKLDVLDQFVSFFAEFLSPNHKGGEAVPLGVQSMEPGCPVNSRYPTYMYNMNIYEKPDYIISHNIQLPAEATQMFKNKMLYKIQFIFKYSI